MKPTWTAADAGCWADGASGHNHVRHMLAWLVVIVNGELFQRLQEEPSDDLSEEDDAIKELNKHTAGATWELVDGDLMLSADEPQPIRKGFKNPIVGGGL